MISSCMQALQSCCGIVIIDFCEAGITVVVIGFWRDETTFIDGWASYKNATRNNDNYFLYKCPRVMHSKMDHALLSSIRIEVRRRGSFDFGSFISRFILGVNFYIYLIGQLEILESVLLNALHFFILNVKFCIHSLLVINYLFMTAPCFIMTCVYTLYNGYIFLSFILSASIFYTAHFSLLKFDHLKESHPSS